MRHRASTATVALGVALQLSACGAGLGAERPWFEEVAADSGLDFVHVHAHTQRFWIPEISPSGVAFLDYDADGWLDVYCVQAGDVQPEVGRELERNRLYRNDGDGTFTDVTEQAGVADAGYGHGCASGDYDNDGDVDLYVTNLRGNVLYRNNGDATFTDVTSEAGVGETKWSTAASFLDYDRDGDYDLFVVNNLNWSSDIEIPCKSAYAEDDYCNPKNYHAPSQDTLFRNDGDGTFTDVTVETGIAAGTGIGLGIACADYDGDGDVDVYVANDSVPNLLWINDGRGHFRNDALLLGCAVNMSGVPEAGMGVQAVDVENDGDWDLFMTHVREESNTFYLNEGGMFEDRTPATGLSVASTVYTGFGVAFHDFDHDGALDLFVANGRVDLWRPRFSEERPFDEPNQLFRGLGGGEFDELEGGPTGRRLLGASRAAAFGDYDNDGDVDVLYSDLHEPIRLLRNEAPKRGEWIGLRLVNSHGSDALGAVVRIQTGARVQYRTCHTSYSYGAANDPRVHFGLGDATGASEVLVTWPGGERERFGALAAGAYHTLRQGGGEPVPTGRSR